jgi:hypothetical protein
MKRNRHRDLPCNVSMKDETEKHYMGNDKRKKKERMEETENNLAILPDPIN